MVDALNTHHYTHSRSPKQHGSKQRTMLSTFTICPTLTTVSIGKRLIVCMCSQRREGESGRGEVEREGRGESVRVHIHTKDTAHLHCVRKSKGGTEERKQASKRERERDSACKRECAGKQKRVGAIKSHRDTETERERKSRERGKGKEEEKEE